MTDLVSLEHCSLIKIKTELDSKFGKGRWARFEPETMALEYSAKLPILLADKISLLRILEVSPLQAFEDPALFLYAAEVINNNPADFGAIPYLTLLEAGYAIESIVQILRDNKVSVEFPEALKKVIKYILDNEGVSESMYPFEFIPSSDLTPGQMPADTAAKKKAIQDYFKYMNSL